MTLTLGMAGRCSGSLRLRLADAKSAEQMRAGSYGVPDSRGPSRSLIAGDSRAGLVAFHVRFRRNAMDDAAMGSRFGCVRLEGSEPFEPSCAYSNGLVSNGGEK